MQITLVWCTERQVTSVTQILFIPVQNSLFCMLKPQMRAGTNRDLSFWWKSRYNVHVQNERWGLGSIENCSKTRCFACKNHRWGLGPIETSDSCANHAVLHAQNDRWGLGHTETCNSGANHDVLHAQSDRWGLGHIQTYNSVPKDAVLQSKSTDEGGDP